jgi:Plavaka transposase
MSFQPFTHGFPHADIHELITPNILHQLIKGTFKDHLVTWVEEYLVLTHGKTMHSGLFKTLTEGVLDLLMRVILLSENRLVAVPPYPGLCHFTDG